MLSETTISFNNIFVTLLIRITICAELHIYSGIGKATRHGYKFKLHDEQTHFPSDDI